jgi:hypothetical protein
VTLFRRTGKLYLSPALDAVLRGTLAQPAAPEPAMPVAAAAGSEEPDMDDGAPLAPGVLGYAVAFRPASAITLGLTDTTLRTAAEARRERAAWAARGEAVVCELRAVKPQ